MNPTIAQQTFAGELETTKQIIREIKAHLFEKTDVLGSTPQVPQAEHKLVNLKEDVRAINAELEQILQAVSLL